MSLTPEIRLRIYYRMLELLLERLALMKYTDTCALGLCLSLTRAMIIVEIDYEVVSYGELSRYDITNMPELMQFKPDTDTAYWWPIRTEEGQQQRIHVVKQCIGILERELGLPSFKR